jgi:hypothetical protein
LHSYEFEIEKCSEANKHTFLIRPNFHLRVSHLVLLKVQEHYAIKKNHEQQQQKLR